MSKLVIEQEHPVRCPECDKVFTFSIEITEADLEKELWVDMDCEHCKVPLTIELEPYLRADTVMHKGTNDANSNSLSLDLPAEILAKKRT